MSCTVLKPPEASVFLAYTSPSSTRTAVAYLIPSHVAKESGALVSPVLVYEEGLEGILEDRQIVHPGPVAGNVLYATVQYSTQGSTNREGEV